MHAAGAGADVALHVGACVQEAAIAWEKRQARIRAKREESKQATQQAKRGWMAWGQPASGASAYDGEGSAAASGKAQEAASATAAAARRCGEDLGERSSSAAAQLVV